MALNHILRRQHYTKPLSYFSMYQSSINAALRRFSSLPEPQSPDDSTQTPKPSSLSARMSFIFDQIDQIDKQREEKDQSLQRIRTWHQSKTNQVHETESTDSMEVLKSELVKSEAVMADSVGKKKEVELVHPWREWVELMERLVEQNYFDRRRIDEEGMMMERIGIDLADVAAAREEEGVQFARDFRSVQAAIVNFGRDRFDILRSLSRHDLQILVGYGCASGDRKVVYASKLIRKLVHLDEGDVCSSCSLRSSCEKAYLLTNKEELAQTVDVMRVLLAYGFDPTGESESSNSLLKMKSVKAVVRKLLHEVVKLSAVPIDPNLPRPIIKKPPPKVKQTPPPPKKRIGRRDVEMKKGDWLCTKCDFLNFAKNTVCIQCDAKRPKRELLPGEWECPQCNFLNYRRNTVCFHCEHNRPPDTYAQNEFSGKRDSPGMRMDKPFVRPDVSNAWNFDFDDNESDGADVAAFEYADSRKLDDDYPLGRQPTENSRGLKDNNPTNRKSPNFSERQYSGTGFNDFDDDDEDDLDSYEVVSQNEETKSSRVRFSELEGDSDTEENDDDNWQKNSSPPRSKKSSKPSFADSEDEIDFNSDDDLPVHPKWKSSHVADRKQLGRDRAPMSFGSDSDLSEDETSRSTKKWGSSRMDGAQGRSRSISDATDSDDDFGYSRNESGRGSPRKASMGRGGMNRRPNSMSDVTDSDDDFGHNRNNQRGISRRDSTRNSSMGRGGMNQRSRLRSDVTDSDDDFGHNRNSRRGGVNRRSRSISDDTDSDDDFGYNNKNKQRGKSSRDGPRKASMGRGGSNRSSGFNRNGRDLQDNFSNRSGGSKYEGRRQGGSFGKRGGRSNKFDSQPDSFPDDGPRRARNNVR